MIAKIQDRTKMDLYGEEGIRTQKNRLTSKENLVPFLTSPVLGLLNQEGFHHCIYRYLEPLSGLIAVEL